MNKKAVEFAWIFAIIIGALILFLAFYFLGTRIFLKEKTEATEKAHSIEILFNPFSYLGAMGATTFKPIELNKKINLSFDCEVESDSGFGKNIIIVDSGLERSVYDKYIFAEDMQEKKIHVISKSFKMPWRVADLVFVFPSSKEYCFKNVPRTLKEELEILNISNIKIDSCSERSIKVCFATRTDCDIVVDETRGYVEKNGQRMYFVGNDYALMLGAIFSKNKAYYECNVKRLFSRMEKQIEIYREKQARMRCRSYVNLETLRQSIPREITSSSMENLYRAAQQVKNQNSYDCPLF